MNQTENNNAPISAGIRYRRWVVLLLLFILFFLGLMLTAQTYLNRTAGAKWISKKLENALNTPVKVDSVHIGLLGDLHVSEFIILDHHSDTLIYAREVSTNLRSISNPTSSKTLNLDDVTLKGGKLNLITYKGERRNNFSMTFNKNPDRSASEESKPFSLGLNVLNVENFRISIHQQNGGSFNDFTIRKGNVSINDIDLSKSRFDVASAQLDGLQFDSEIQESNPLADLPSHPIDTTNNVKMPENGNKFHLTIGDFWLNNGQFELHNYVEAPEWNGNFNRINYNHMRVDDISIRADNFTMYDLNFEAWQAMLSFESPTGFELSAMDVGHVVVDTQTVRLEGLNMMTPYSQLNDTLVLKYAEYPSWRDFNNKVFIDASLNKSFIALRDIMTFAPGLYDNTFFINAESEVIEVDGKVQGRINSLKGRSLELRLGDDIEFKGNIRTRDLALNNQQFFGMDIERLQLDVLSLEKLIPNFVLPPNFNKLQVIDYKGRFDGYFQDFVTYGTLNSPLGRAKLDMRLDLKKGREAATYSGALSLIDFDLEKWSNNSNLGDLSMSVSVKEGKGLVLENAEVALEGVIQKFVFNNHSYEDMQINGALSKSSFVGVLNSGSENADFDFNGSITGLDSIPVYQFTAEIDHIRLKELNLSRQQFDFGGRLQVAFRGLNWKELIGQGGGQGLWLISNNKDTLNLDSVYISQVDLNDGRKLKLESGSGTVSIEGVYDLLQMHRDILHILGENHPQLSDLASIPEYPHIDSIYHDYTFNIRLDDRHHIINYFTKSEVDVKQVQLDGHVSTVNESLKLVGRSPQLKIGSTTLQLSDFSFMNEGPLLIYKWETDAIAIRDKVYFTDVVSEGNFTEDQGKLGLTYIDPKRILEDVQLNAEFRPENNRLKVSLDPAYFSYAGETWRFLPGNSLTVGGKELLFDDFTLSSYRQVLQIDDVNDGRGIKAVMTDISTDIIDSLLSLQGFDFDGRFSASLAIGDYRKMKDIDFRLRQSELLVNDRSNGSLDIHVHGRSYEEGLDFNMDIHDGTKGIRATGEVKASGYEADITIDKYPLNILEYIIKSGISGTEGEASGNVKLKGVKNDFDLIGDLVATGSTRVDYIGVKYAFEDQRVVFSPDFMDFTNVKIVDIEGNTGTVDGGLIHRSLKDWQMDLTIGTDRLMMLNTTSSDNPDYYGTAIGVGEVDFYGTFENPFIYIVAESLPGTSLVIPVSEGEELTSDFVEFIKKDTIQQADSTNSALDGLDLEMKLTVTEDALMKIIFDEQAGDILEGTGRGNMVVKLSPNGTLSVYGEYKIERGEYLFTLLNFVNKPFTLERGGTIRWTGDPIDALINLTAGYKGLSASPAPLILDLNTSNENLTNAQRPTRVDLGMKLRGSLLQPLIEFDIRLPDLVGEVKTYVDNRLQTMRNDPNELNRQVFGLVVFGSFLPSANQSSLANNLGSSTVNTLGEFLSTQLSTFVSGILNDIVDDVGFISSVDVDLAYIQKFDSETATNNISDGEYQFRVRNRLWNDRWVVTLGGNYGNQSFFTNDPYFNPETVVEWNTPVNGLKLRVYYRGEDSLQGQRQLVGGGIRYRKEFDTLSDFLGQLKKEENRNKTQ